MNSGGMVGVGRGISYPSPSVAEEITPCDGTHTHAAAGPHGYREREEEGVQQFSTCTLVMKTTSEFFH